MLQDWCKTEGHGTLDEVLDFFDDFAVALGWLGEALAQIRPGPRVVLGILASVLLSSGLWLYVLGFFLFASWGRTVRAKEKLCILSSACIRMSAPETGYAVSVNRLCSAF